MTRNIQRILDLAALARSRSVLLLGPRQTGKSWLLRHQLPESRQFNLLQSETYLSLSRAPQKLREGVRVGELILIDEIQRIPDLLNEVHLLIEEKQARFIISGSSARKLRKAGVNLLGGRARMIRIHPLSAMELKEDFNLGDALNFGLLPSVVLETNLSERVSRLDSYVNEYLQQEIIEEGVSRNIPAFSRFLVTAALCNAQLVNFNSLANDAQVSPSTVREYFSVIEDSLIVSRLESWRESKKRKPTSTAKFYFFDTGVLRHIQGLPVIQPGHHHWGNALETYIFHELSCYSDYHSREKLSFWRTQTGVEVDFLLGERLAIEVKSSAQVSRKMLKGLRALREEGVFKHYILLCDEPFSRIVEGVEIVPVKDFVSRLWAGDWQ